MATIDRIKGFRVMIFTKEPENERPHVHFVKGRKSAKVWLDDLSFARKGAFNRAELSAIEKIIKQKQQIYMKAWQEEKG